TFMGGGGWGRRRGSFSLGEDWAFARGGLSDGASCVRKPASPPSRPGWVPTGGGGVMTESFWAATQSDTAVLMLAASDGPDLDDVLTVLVRHAPDYVLVHVAGEVDFSSAAGLRERLFTLASAGRPLVADLDRVSFID